MALSTRNIKQQGNQIAELLPRIEIIQQLGKEAFGEMAISGTIVREVEDLLESHGKILVMHALDETILNNGRSIRYTRSILERWKGQGLNTIEQVKQSKAAREAKKQQTNQPEPQTREEWLANWSEENPF